MPRLRLVNFACFNDAQSQLITAGVDGVCIFEFVYKSKYSPKRSAQIDAAGNYVEISLTYPPKAAAKSLAWIKGLNVDQKNGIIISWSQGQTGSQVQVAFHRLADGELINKMQDLIDSEEQIWDVLVFTEYRYFLTATDAGNVYVWKYIQDKKVENSKRLIHAF